MKFDRPDTKNGDGLFDGGHGVSKTHRSRVDVLEQFTGQPTIGFDDFGKFFGRGIRAFRLFGKLLNSGWHHGELHARRKREGALVAEKFFSQLNPFHGTPGFGEKREWVLEPTLDPFLRPEHGFEASCLRLLLCRGEGMTTDDDFAGCAGGVW